MQFPRFNSIFFSRRLLMASGFILLVATPAISEEQAKVPAPKVALPERDELTVGPTKVDVTPIARDEEIQKRLKSVLDATEWYVGPIVRVQQGVVFLKGQVKSEELKKWAGDLARNTQDVVAVSNQMTVIQAPIWDLTPAWAGLLVLWRDFINSLPFVALGFLILLFSLVLGLFSTRGLRLFLRHRVQARLLRNVISRGVGLTVVFIGFYLVLRISGLTQLALTMVGGTGLIGLALGIAFREITENFLASIFLSVQRPFETGDLIEVSGITGYIQQLNMRTTVLMSLDGTMVQIPNAAVYKSNLRNFTTNNNRREEFTIGIGYRDSINEAQEIARKVLFEHPAILNDPEPMILADSMGQSTIILRVYFWLNGREHSWLKVRSSVIRLVKLAFQKHGISMPDSAREIIFPNGVPVTMIEKMAGPREPSASDSTKAKPSDSVSTKAEAGLSSEADVIEDQARKVSFQGGENLLQNPSSETSNGKNEKT